MRFLEDGRRLETMLLVDRKLDEILKRLKAN